MPYHTSPSGGNLSTGQLLISPHFYAHKENTMSIMNTFGHILIVRDSTAPIGLARASLHVAAATKSRHNIDKVDITIEPVEKVATVWTGRKLQSHRGEGERAT